MAEPENHTLLMLREIRTAVAATDSKVEALAKKVDALDGKVNALDGKVNALDGKVNALDDKVDALDVKIDRIHADLRGRLDTVTQAVAGEIIQSRYVTAAVDEKLTNFERRLTALESAQ